MSSVVIKKFKIDENNHIASVVLNRPEQANAFNADILDNLILRLEELKEDKGLRVLLFQSKGKHFSAGADLKWMQSSAQLSKKENIEDATKLTRMFDSILNFPRPTIAIVKGAAYGGAVGITACCDYAVALDNARFSLSEVRIGLIPAVIMPYLAKKISHQALRRLALSGRVFSAQEAINYGLVSEAFSSLKLVTSWLDEELREILKASPDAQRACKELLQKLTDNGMKQGDFTAQAIAEIRTSEAGQAGLNAFLNKKPSPWLCELNSMDLLEE